MRISFERGVPSAAAQIVGGGMVITAPQYTLAWWVGCALLVFGFCLLMWGIRWDQKPWWQAVGSRYPERHKTILHDLADALAEVQDLALRGRGGVRIHPMFCDKSTPRNSKTLSRRPGSL